MEHIYLGIIDDNALIRESMEMYLQKSTNIEVTVNCKSVETFIHKNNFRNEKKVDILLLGTHNSKNKELSTIPYLKQKFPQTDIIIFSSIPQEDNLFEAMCNGAVSYIPKNTPLSKIEEAIFSIYRGGSFMSPSIGRKVAQHFAASNKKAIKLTARQYQIVQSIVDGLSYNMIAIKYEISINSVRDHIKKIYKLLHINSKSELIKKMMGGHLGVRG